MREFPARTLIVDDHPLYSDALRVALSSLNPDGEAEVATDIADARGMLAGDGEFDLVLLDLVVGEGSGLSLIAEARARHPDCRIVVVSSREEHGAVQSAREMGADGFIGKSSALPEIVEALRSLSMAQPAVEERASLAQDEGSGQRIAGLSPAQMRILVALADGRLNKQIAFDLGLAEPTVKSHLSAIFKKLGVNNRTQAILVARALTPSVGEVAAPG